VVIRLQACGGVVVSNNILLHTMLVETSHGPTIVDILLSLAFHERLGVLKLYILSITVSKWP